MPLHPARGRGGGRARPAARPRVTSSARCRNPDSDRRRPSRSYAAPPTKAKPKPSPRWYGFLVLGLILLGVLIIVLNYANFLLPGGTQQHWLWIGLGMIGAGFVAATRWR